MPSPRNLQLSPATALHPPPWKPCLLNYPACRGLSVCISYACYSTPASFCCMLIDCDVAKDRGMRRLTVRHVCLTVRVILFAHIVIFFGQADGSILPNKADLDRIDLLRVSLASLEDTPPRLWRTALSQLYSGRTAPQRGLPSRLEPIARFLTALSQSRAPVPGTCAKACTFHKYSRFQVRGTSPCRTLCA